jgi:hypothetical protein
MEFHPFANEYPMMPSFELGLVEQDMRQNGFDARFPIYFYQIKILDGRNRFLAAKAANIKPVFREFIGTDEEAKEFVKRANEHRRHLTEDWLRRRRKERIERVAEARAEGQSIRTIAEAEKVSEKTVRNDIAEQVRTPSAPEPAKPKKTTGKDGKTYPAEKPKPTPAKPKSGKPRFDEKKFDKVFGPLVRLVNERGNAMGKGPNYQRCHEALNEFMDAYKSWKKETA